MRRAVLNLILSRSSTSISILRTIRMVSGYYHRHWLIDSGCPIVILELINVIGDTELHVSNSFIPNRVNSIWTKLSFANSDTLYSSLFADTSWFRADGCVLDRQNSGMVIGISRHLVPHLPRAVVNTPSDGLPSVRYIYYGRIVFSDWVRRPDLCEQLSFAWSGPWDRRWMASFAWICDRNCWLLCFWIQGL